MFRGYLNLFKVMGSTALTIKLSSFAHNVHIKTQKEIGQLRFRSLWAVLLGRDVKYLSLGGAYN